MAELKEFLEIVLVLAALAGLLYLYLKIATILDAWNEKAFPGSHRWRRRRTNLELQTLFHGNTKDEDQI